MNKLSRGAIAALAAAIAIPAGVAIARHGDHGHGGWHKMSPQARERLDEGKLAMAKTALKLSPEQDKLWSALETEIRAGFKMRAERMAERQKMREERGKQREESKDDGKDDSASKPDLAERINKMSQRMSERAERAKAFAAAFTPLYASLSDEQKEVMRPLLHDLMGGRGGHGKRWAMGSGWGGHEGRGHGGWHHRGHGDGGGEGRRMGRHGGSDRDDDEGEPPVEQFMPETDEGGASGPDSL
jgi:hypothetical protein